MTNLEIPDPLFREAMSAVDPGNVSALERLLVAHPTLVRDRINCGEAYFRQPYLLWFVAEHSIRNSSLPANTTSLRVSDYPRVMSGRSGDPAVGVFHGVNRS